MTITPNRQIVTIITETLIANRIMLGTILKLKIVVKKRRPERKKILIIYVKYIEIPPELLDMRN